MKHSQSGFTLIEMIIAVSISAVVIAGAMSVQLVFHRSTNEEESIADMQANLDGIRFYVQKSMRQVGAGLGASVSFYNCRGGVETVNTIGVHNSNSIPVAPDITDGGTDTDPDWIEYTLASNLTVTYIDGQFSRSWADVKDNTGFNHKNVLGLTINGVTCLMRLTNTVSNAHGDRLHFAPAHGGPFCMNQVITMESCGLYTNAAQTPSSPIPIINLGEFPFHALRVDNTTSPDSPMLMHGVRMMQDDSSDYIWTPLALGVEDMQLAFHVDTSDPPDGRGDIWVSSRDTLATEVGRMRALRISIVIRTPTPTSPIATARPAFEDRPAGDFDRYKRRTMRFVAKIPNRPSAGGTF
ncbi:MAG: hypothetical protein CVU65_04185 [Deltaproteobacteria bacterium HGW-Deltaproteobacteria-22]|nr:MAG: hypothetical protein CVU65_04185 [Deltaproteobacteria bacterium HGW-Deltaproteobacteria-22]